MQGIAPCRGQWRHWATFLTEVESPVILQWVWRKVSWRGRDVERNQRITDSRSVARHNLGWDQNWCSHLPLYHRHASFDILSILFLFQIKYFLIHGCLNLGDTPSSCPELQLLVTHIISIKNIYMISSKIFCIIAMMIYILCLGCVSVSWRQHIQAVLNDGTFVKIYIIERVHLHAPRRMMGRGQNTADL